MNNITILKRPPFDLFTFRLFYRLINSTDVDLDGIYVWSSVLDLSYIHHEHCPDEETSADYRVKLFNAFKKDTIVLGIKDHLTGSNDFNPWLESIPDIVEGIGTIVTAFSNKKFIILTSVENLNAYLKYDNLTIVPWGGDLTNQVYEYKKIEPILDKNLDSTTNYISLNRNMRNHRAILVSLLYGMEIDNMGLVSCMFNNILKDTVEYTQWQFTEEQQHIKDIVRRGSTLLTGATLPIDDSIQIYENNDNDNVFNFKNKLTNYYQNTFVEIISETSYTEKCFLLTEKTLNSIYGCNFPILLCSQGAVKFLRDMGFDMFDDIIDHSYDSIENPIDRMYAAITDNKELLTNNVLVKELWIKNKHRFLNNINFAKVGMYEFYATRAIEEFEKCL